MTLPYPKTIAAGLFSLVKSIVAPLSQRRKAHPGPLRLTRVEVKPGLVEFFDLTLGGAIQTKSGAIVFFEPDDVAFAQMAIIHRYSSYGAKGFEATTITVPGLGLVQNLTGEFP